MQERYHFIGIGGAGMSGLARLLLSQGVGVSGSDLRESETTQRLRDEGALVQIGHAAAHVADATHVVYSAAVDEENPELLEARRRELPTLVRADLLGKVMAQRRGIAIAGTHGKTTTTGMVASIWMAADLDPTVLVGGDWDLIGGNTRVGGGPHFIAEACEAFHSFLHLSPQAALLTNIEADHLDCFGSLEGVVEAFTQFLAQVQGYVVGCRDDAEVRRLLSRTARHTVTYGFEDGADYVAVDLMIDGPEPSFTVAHEGEALGEVSLSVPGRHNVLNALGAAALALEEGLPFEAVARGLRAFEGVQRRFEVLGEVDDVLVVDDYAHHPTEIRATLSAARRSTGRYIWAVFQPHLYDRTHRLMDDFAESFQEANRVIVTDIYAARDRPIEGVSGKALADLISEREPDRQVEHAGDREQLVRLLAREARPGDLILTLGAGDIREVGERLVQRLEADRGASVAAGGGK